MLSNISVKKKYAIILVIPIFILFIVLSNVSPVTSLYGDIILNSDEWLQGEGVEVYENSNSFTGQYQCVELAKRLYMSKGWPIVKTADGGAKSIPEGSPDLQKFTAGSGYVPVPGDLIIEGGTSINGGYGHVAIVDRVEDNSIYAVEQNGASTGKVIYTYNDSYYAGSNNRGSIIAIMHAPQNQYQDELQDLFLGRVRVTNIDLSGYDVEINLLSSELTSKIGYTTWNEIRGEEHQVWAERVINDTENIVTLRVNKADYNNSSGLYHTDIHVYDTNGTVISSRSLTTTIPEVQHVKIETVDQEGYTISGNIVGAGHLDRLEIHSWSMKEGSDDLIIDTVDLVEGDFNYRMNIVEHHNETGKYLSRIYIYDQQGQSKFYDLPVTVIPELNNITIENQMDNQYTVSATIVNPDKIATVEIESYTKWDGFNKAIRSKMPINEGNVKINILLSDFSNQRGEYLNTLYVTDIYGAKTSYKIDAYYDELYDLQVTEVDATGYTVEAKVYDTKKYNASDILFSTTSESLKEVTWKQGKLHKDKISYRVNQMDHNFETGEYHTHIQLTNKKGHRTTYTVEQTVS